MAELIVLGFKDTATADTVVPRFRRCNRRVCLNWPTGRVIRGLDGKIDVREGTSTTGVGAAGGALWGILFGLLFLMRLAGLAPARRRVPSLANSPTWALTTNSSKTSAVS